MLFELPEAFAISLTWRLEGAISREVETSMLAFPPVISTGPKATMGGGFGALIKPDTRMYKTAEMTTETRTTTTTTTTMIKARLSRRGGGAG